MGKLKLIAGEILNLHSDPNENYTTRWLKFKAGIGVKPPYRIDGFLVDSALPYTLGTLYYEIFLRNVYKIDKGLNNVIDAGANVGMFGLKVKKHNPDCVITGFEPIPATYGYLLKNLVNNKIKGYKPINEALVGERRFVEMSADPCSCANSVYGKAGVIKVKGAPLSDYINDRVDLLKMDIEGAEYQVIPELVNSGKIKYVRRMCIEFHFIHTMDYIEAAQAIKHEGFKITMLDIFDTNNFMIEAVKE